MRLRTAAAFALTLLIAAAAHAQRNDTLEVGDQAPGLDVEKWIGDEVTIQTDKVYVVLFFETTDSDTVRLFPTISEIELELGVETQISFLAVTEEETETVEAFVRRQQDKIAFPIAVDRRSSTHRAWFQAAGLRNHPGAFIVDRKSRIAFIGDPFDDEFPVVLRRVMRNRYDPILEQQARAMLKVARDNRKVRNWRVATMHYDEVIDLDPQIFADVALEKFEMQLVDMSQKPDAYRYARTLINSTFAGDPDALRMLAEKIVSDPAIPEESRDLDIALAAAQAVVAQTGGDSPYAFATLAMVHFHRGEYDDAVELQKRAYFKVRPIFKSEFRRVLTAYQEAQRRAAGTGG